jgi:hypothetical protein
LLRHGTLILSCSVLLSVQTEPADADSRFSFQGRCGPRSIPASDHIQPIGILYPRVRPEPAADAGSTLKLLNLGNTFGGTRGLAREEERSKIMPLIQLLEVLVVVGVLLWLVNRFIPMQSSIKSILNGVVVIAVVLWLLNIFGLFHSLSGIRLGKG